MMLGLMLPLQPWPEPPYQKRPAYEQPHCTCERHNLIQRDPSDRWRRHTRTTGRTEATTHAVPIRRAEALWWLKAFRYGAFR